ncbi:MAG: hypothetical protein AAF573_19260 [Bacteroidota bacterium]
MKKLLFFLLAGTLMFMSCKNDDDNDGRVELRYDDPNETAPPLPAGTFDAGVRFPRNIVNNYIGQNLTEVDFYIQQRPTDCVVLVYGEGTAESPGSLLYSKNVSSEVSANSWNLHTLDTPIALQDEDIWIVVRLIHNANTSSIGCDNGPATTNGDWMLGENENEWRTYRSLTNGQVSVNWNIRGYLTPQ